MAFLATNIFDADGVRTYWDFSFAGVSPDSDSGTTPYLYAADVKALELYRDIAGNAQAAVRLVTIDPSLPTRANIDGAPIVAGRQVKIYRQTEIRFPLVDYRDRQTVSELDLDLSNRQAIFVAQETQDAAKNSVILDAHDNYDMQDRRIVNLAPGVDLHDAVNMEQYNRTVRGPDNEGALPELSSAAVRANKILSFDVFGNPVATVLSSGSAAALEMSLADPALGARMIGSGLTVVNSVSDLAALNTSQPSQFAQTLGYAAPSDGGHGVWRFVLADLSTSVTADPKRGLFVAPASAPTGVSGAWVRLISSQKPVPEWWGEYAAPRYSSSTSQGVSLRKNRVGATQDHWVLQFGDSHSWGQGATEGEVFATTTNYSIYSSNIHSLGYMARMREDIAARRRFHTFTYGANLPVAQNTIIGPGFYGADWLERSLKDPNGHIPLLPICGEIILNQSALTAPQTTANTAVKFYSPVARSAAYAVPFREKLARGLFGAHVNVLRKESDATFRAGGKDVFIELNVNMLNAGSGGSYTQALSAGGGIIGERLTATGAVFLSTTQTEFPTWMAVNSLVMIPGAGQVKIQALNAVSGGTAIEIRNNLGGFLPATFMRTLVDRMRLYHPDYVNRAVYRVPLQGPTRTVYMAVRHKLNGGTLHAYFVDNIQTGGAGGPVLGRNGTPSLTANGWEWKGAPANLIARRVMPNGTWVSSASASFSTDRAIINTGEITAGVIEEVIYRLDFGAVQHGDFYIELASGADAEIRGVIADNNKVVNCSIGGRTVAQWLGGSGEEDRVAQILEHVPVQPSHVITQIPFVNEYIAQTSIVGFKANLLTFINRFRNHIPAQANYNAQGVDFLFFTSLRDRGIAFQGAASSPVTYDMYVTAAKEVCAAEGCVFIDAEAALFTAVRSGYVDYERLYSDSIHPSDYANELIYEEVKKYLPQIV